MKDYLVLKLQSPLQAWGRESFEGLRPSELYPGRSALLGLLGACLGVERNDQDAQHRLASSIYFAVRVDQQGQKLTDYHTVKDARVEYSGLKSHETIQTWREYWQDAKYTVVAWLADEATLTLNDLEQAIQKPRYTPVLGRRSCPLTRPLYETKVLARTALDALSLVEPLGGTIYSDEFSEDARPLKKRDVPIIQQPRQFASRMVYMSRGEGGRHVPE